MEQAMMWFFGRAAYEQRKPKEAQDEKGLREDLKQAASIAADVACYQQPKLTAMRVGGDSEGEPINLNAVGEIAVTVKGGLPVDPQALPPEQPLG
jgi:hypothetical protein